jgi:hypothetical protein
MGGRLPPDGIAMSLPGYEQTFHRSGLMSVLPPEADIQCAASYFR